MSILDAPFPQTMNARAYPGGAASYGQSVLIPGSPFGISAAEYATGKTILFDTDCSGFASIEVETSGTFTGQAFALEETIDGKTWYNVPCMRTTDNSPTQPTQLSGAATRYSGELGGLRVRGRLTALATGTLCIVAALHMARRGRMLMNVGGQVGDGVAITGNGVRLAARAVSASPTAVATGQTADLLSTLDRRLVVLTDAIPENTWSYAAVAGGIVDTTAATLKAAGAAGIRNYLRSLQAINTAAVASEVAVRDGASGTVLWRGHLPASMTAPANIAFTPPLRGSAATLMEVVVLTTATKTYLNAQGYTAS